MVEYEAKVFIYSLRFLKFTSVFVINVKINPQTLPIRLHISGLSKTAKCMKIALITYSMTAATKPKRA